MPTFLTNPKMPAALTRRIERSLGMRKASTPRQNGAIVLLRAVSVSLLIVAVANVYWLHQRQTQELAEARQDLLTRVERESAALTDDADVLLETLQRWLMETSGPYPGDFVAPEFRTSEGLAQQLRRPTIYVRGPLSSFSDETSIGRTATESRKDALLLCLLTPPQSDQEHVLFEKVRAAYRGAHELHEAEHVQRLYAALTGLPVLSADWAARVQAAEDVRAVQYLSELFALAPIREAQLAARSELFIFASDESKIGAGPSEFDGANRHYVRVHVVDLEESKVLLRLRRIVDPAWISERQRQRYAKGLNGCRLAMEVRQVALAAK